jgi:pSer/pThr/pTyr-binding forkhead associated (FHA) protein
VRSYLLSWLARQHGSNDAQMFEEKFSGSWLVWEAGPWHPPQDGRTTLFATGRKAPSPSEEALALQIAPRAGKPRFEGVQLGRGRENDLVIEDATLSRAHLLFRFDGENCTVEDLGSSNGTFVDGAAVHEAAVALAPGACIEAGAVRFTYYDVKALRLRVRHGIR